MWAYDELFFLRMYFSVKNKPGETILARSWKLQVYCTIMWLTGKSKEKEKKNWVALRNTTRNAKCDKL